MMKNKPLVSVIMSEYNTDVTLLRESINSILNQSYKNLEVIIIDDCGRNNMKKIIEKYNDDRIRLFQNKKNMGLVYSLNKAINYSKGKYIARMDTDDFAYSTRIEKQVEFLENNIDFSVVGCRVDYYDGKKIFGSSNKKGTVTKKDILTTCPLIHPTVMYRKEAINSIGGYLNYYRCEDYATWINMFVNNIKMFNLDLILLRYHISYYDYKKRGLKERKDYFKMINNEYIKLKPSIFQLLYVKVKAFISGILPNKVMELYHKGKARKHE